MIDWIGDHLAIIMFLVLTFIMFVGYPVAFVLGAIGIIFGYLGILFGVFNMVQFANLLPRVYGGEVKNQLLVAVPMCIFMGTVLEGSGVAEELLKCLQIHSTSNLLQGDRIAENKLPECKISYDKVAQFQGE